MMYFINKKRKERRLPPLPVKVLCVPGIVGFTVTLDAIGEIPTAEVEIGFGDNFATPVLIPVGNTDPAEGFDITLKTTGSGGAPLRPVKEMVLVGFDVFAHETLSSRDGDGTDFTDPNALQRGAGHLEIVDVGLVVTPRHRENVANFDVVGIRFVTIVFTHYGYKIRNITKKVNSVFLRTSSVIRANHVL